MGTPAGVAMVTDACFGFPDVGGLGSRESVADMFSELLEGGRVSFAKDEGREGERR